MSKGLPRARSRAGPAGSKRGAPSAHPATSSSSSGASSRAMAARGGGGTLYCARASPQRSSG